MSDDLERRSTLSGLSVGEAKEFNRIFVISFCIFVAIAIVAHYLAWMWRPWLPGVHGYQTSMLDGVHMARHLISSFG
jgi:light-harvesting complex 1 beta chain